MTHRSIYPVILVLFLTQVGQAMEVNNQTIENFPCGTDWCSMKNKAYCNEGERRCDRCEREMSRCGTDQMVNMRNTCLIYCYRDLKERKLELQLLDIIKANNQSLADQKHEIAALEAERDKLKEDYDIQTIRVKVLGVAVALIALAFLCFALAVKKGYLCNSGRPAEGVTISAKEEESLLENVTGPDVGNKLSASEEAENDEASSGRGSAETSLAGSKEKLEPAKVTEPLLQAGIDQEGLRPQEASRGRSPPRAQAPRTPRPIPAVKGGMARPNNGQGFPDLPRGDSRNGEEESPSSLAHCPAPAASAVPAQNMECLYSRAQELSDLSKRTPNCCLAEEMHKKITGIRDTAPPHTSALTPN